MSDIQLQLFHEKNITKQFGGTLLKGRKKKRPLSTRLPIHLVLRSSHNESARALSYRMKRNRMLLERVARKFQIKVYQSVFNYTHVHLVIKVPSREAYVSFIRLFSSGLAELAALKEGKLFTQCNGPALIIKAWR